MINDRPIRCTAFLVMTHHTIIDKRIFTATMKKGVTGTLFGQCRGGLGGVAMAGMNHGLWRKTVQQSMQ